MRSDAHDFNRGSVTVLHERSILIGENFILKDAPGFNLESVTVLDERPILIGVLSPE